MSEIAENNEVIYADDVWKSYGRTPALVGLSFSVSSGIFGFVGPNGAGKTTFMKILAGLLSPDKGEVRLMGESISIKNKKRVGFVYDKGMFPPEIQVGYFLEKIQSIYNVSRRDRVFAIETCNLKDVLDMKMGHLSAGYKRRVNLATAIMHNPELLIMDEPFNEIDPISRIKIKDAIQTLRKDGINFFISSHNLTELEEISTHYGIINKGKLVKQGVLGEQGADKFVLVKGDNNDAIKEFFKGFNLNVETSGAYVTVHAELKNLYDILKNYPGEIYEIKTASLEEELKGVVNQ